jgi:hypothetical protein
VDESRRIRASDAERERVARFLAAAFADGRLDLVEYDHRTAAVYAAVFRDELTPLLDDLPPPDEPLFDVAAAVTGPLETPAALPRPAPPVARDGDRPYGWAVAVALLGCALCLARFGLFRPSTALLLLLGVGIVLHWISGRAGRR